MITSSFVSSIETHIDSQLTSRHQNRPRFGQLNIFTLRIQMDSHLRCSPLRRVCHRFRSHPIFLQSWLDARICLSNFFIGKTQGRVKMHARAPVPQLAPWGPTFTWHCS
jgi:hypothetical protein